MYENRGGAEGFYNWCIYLHIHEVRSLYLGLSIFTVYDLVCDRFKNNTLDVGSSPVHGRGKVNAGNNIETQRKGTLKLI